jgi:hypothetical protein
MGFVLMANEIRHFTLTIPAGTPATAPVRQPMTLPARVVDALELIVPPGGAGLIGFRVCLSGVPIIPYQSDAWIITADDKIKWDLEEYPNSGDWSLEGYNSGTVDHAVFCRMLVRVPQLIATAPPPVADLTGMSDDAADLVVDDTGELT